MTESEKAITAFLMKGGKVTTVKEGVTSKDNVDLGLRYCQCGCEGNYTDHTMRLGEKGEYKTN